MTWDRRQILAGGLGLGAISAGPRAAAAPASGTGMSIDLASLDVTPDSGSDQTETLQKAIDAAAISGQPITFPPGRYLVKRLRLRPGTHLHGVPGKTVLEYGGGGAFLVAEGARNVRLSGLLLDGAHKTLDRRKRGGALLAADNVADLAVTDCDIVRSKGHGIALNAVSGAIRGSRISNVDDTALFSEDAAGLEISDNVIADCGNNGIQVWRSGAGEDGTIVAHNRVQGVRADAGGSGQNGNGINIFRAGSVMVTSNRVTDCAFSAIRGNAASNAQIIANSCARLGEVAIYAEFGFEGAIVANNLVDGALTGISITNFNEGGRLAVVQGNLIRNLRLDAKGRGHGIGIAVEADTMVSGNVIEGAPGVGIQLGWGRFLRDASAMGNIVRQARIGIAISADPKAGYVVVANNMISGASEGAIRAMDHAKPLGPDLATESAESYRNMAIFGNVAL